MHQSLILISSAILTAVLILSLRGVADRLALVDKPDARKTHSGVIPIHGGLCMALVMLIAGAVLYGVRGVGPSESVLILGLAVFGVIGVLDDLRDLSARLRLIIELGLLYWLMVTYDFHIDALGNIWGFGAVQLEWLAIPFTLFAVFCLINGINMLDGMDGLAGGVSAICILWFMLAASLVAAPVPPLIWVMLGAIAGFLFFNARAPWRKRASVFMGDAGSLVLGFVLSWCCVAFTQGDLAGGEIVIRPMTAVWILALPVIDTVYVVLHRARKGVGIFTPGRDHIHHRLQQLGFSDESTVRLLWLLAAILGGVGVLGDYLQVPEPVMCYGFILLSVIYYFVAARMRRHDETA